MSRNLLGISYYVQNALKCPQIKANCDYPWRYRDKVQGPEILMSGLANNNAHNRTNEGCKRDDGKNEREKERRRAELAGCKHEDDYHIERGCQY